MSVVVFVISLAAITVIAVAGLASVLMPGWQFWPPPDLSSGQHRLFWWSFRVYFVGLVTLSVFDFAPLAEGTWWWRIGVGVFLLVFGFGLALCGTGQLGWANAHGAQERLKTVGMYRWGRE